MLESDDKKLPKVTEDHENLSEEITEKTVQSSEKIGDDLQNTNTTEPVESPSVTDEKLTVDENEQLQEAEVNQLKETVTKSADENTSKAVEDIEKQIAIDSEDEDPQQEIPEVKLEPQSSAEDIVDLLKVYITTYPVQKIATHVEQLKKKFNVKFGALLSEARKKHKEAGGEPSDFHYENPVQQSYNDILYDYKNKKQAFKDRVSKERNDNLINKQALIEELKNLIDNGNPDNIYDEFKALQEKWRAVGPVPRDAYKDLWNTYQFHVERFYDLIHLRNELRDMDFQHNLEEKTKLILKAEALAEIDDVKTAFSELQILHRIWKEDIGPVSRDYREEIWNRFSEATKKIHDKRHNYFDSLKETFEQNLLKKEALLQELEKFNTLEHKSHGDWQKSIKQVDKLRKQFIKAGRVPKRKDRETWEKFRSINKVFNHTKNQYYKEVKVQQQANLDKKMALIEIAESYRETESWNEAVEVMKKIQQDWKNIGHVPRRASDKIWNRFKEACNHFFDRYREAMDSIEESQMSVYIKKKKYFNDLKERSTKDEFKPSIEELMILVNEWKDLGVVPKKQYYIEVKFNKFLDPFFDKVSEDKTKLSMMRYKTHIDSIIEQNDTRRINDEVQFVRKKIDFISREKQQMETNSQFFSNTDDSSPMMKEINQKIDKLSSELELWESKLQYLRSVDF